MDEEWYINLRCKKCGRYSGTILKGRLNQEKVVGCKICKTSTTMRLQEQQHLVIGDLEINSGRYYYCDC